MGASLQQRALQNRPKFTGHGSPEPVCSRPQRNPGSCHITPLLQEKQGGNNVHTHLTIPESLTVSSRSLRVPSGEFPVAILPQGWPQVLKS